MMFLVIKFFFQEILKYRAILYCFLLNLLHWLNANATKDIFCSKFVGDEKKVKSIIFFSHSLQQELLFQYFMPFLLFGA